MITFESEKIKYSRKYKLNVTLFRNKDDARELNDKCSTHGLEVIERNEKNIFNIFIQLEKPVYKPSDIIRYRILVIGMDLLPYRFNNICVEIYDSFNRLVYNETEPEELDDGSIFGELTTKIWYVTSFGYTTHEYTYSPGIWRIQTTIDNENSSKTVKRFSVQEYTLPLFNVHLNIWDHDLLENSFLQFSFYAKYPFDEYVHGNAMLVIKSLKNDRIVLTKHFKNVSNIHDVKHSIRDFERTTKNSKLEYEIKVIFTEDKSGFSASKSSKITVHPSDKPIIHPVYPEKYTNGLPFSIKVYVYDWKGKEIKRSWEKVTAILECQLQKGLTEKLVKESEIEHGFSIHNFIIPEYAVGVKVKIEYETVLYEKTIERGNETFGVSILNVDHSPKK